jgi:TPR repeat protein
VYGRLTVEKVHLGAEQFDDALRWYQKAAQTKPDDARGKEGKWLVGWLRRAGRGGSPSLQHRRHLQTRRISRLTEPST